MTDFQLISKLRAIAIVESLLDGTHDVGVYKRAYTKRRCLPDGSALPDPDKAVSSIHARQYKDQYCLLTKAPNHHSMVGDVCALGRRFYFRHSVDSIVLEPGEGKWIKTDVVDSKVEYKGVEHESWCYWPDVEELISGCYTFDRHMRLKLRVEDKCTVEARLKRVKESYRV